MKAETLKPFISSPSVTEYVGNRKRNVIVIGLSVFLFIIIASLFGFTIWNSIRVTQLQRRIDSLNKFVDNMHKRLGLDYLDELNEFENNYANNDDLIDDPDDDDEDSDEDEDGQLLNQFDSNDYDEENKSRNSKNSKENDDLETGSGSYDDDDDDDDDEESDDEYDDEDVSANHEDNGDKLFDDYEKFVGAKQRRTRSVSSGLKSDAQLKVHNETDVEQNKNRKVEKSLKTPGAQLKLVFENFDEVSSDSHLESSESIQGENKEIKIKQHQKAHQTNMKIVEEEPQVKHKLSLSAGKDEITHSQDHQYHDYILYPSSHKKKMHDDVTSKQITTTSSSSSSETENIMHNSRNKRKMMKLRNGAEDSTQNHNHHRSRTGKLNSHYHHQDRQTHLNIIAAHFNLNRFHMKENSNNDNDALLNHQRDFENSIYLPTISSWSTRNQLLRSNNQDQHEHHQHHHNHHHSPHHDTYRDDSIPMEATNNILPTVQNGIVTVHIPGIYYIYAQIFYHNNKDRNGYWIYHNTKPFLQCYSTIPNDIMEKGNTCYTSGVIYLTKGDTIHLKDMYKDHSAILGTSKSFFGLVRLGDAEYYHYSNR